MENNSSPYISAEKSIAELTVRGILLAIFLTVILAMSNAYLALKLGILTSASIPAAIISMGILRFFKNATILENNAVQTAASAGEAVAGGIVYTIPALIVIGYWHHFDYITNFLIAALGGFLGVLFSIPLRRILVNDQSLRFPEGKAIAEVLKTSAENVGLKDIALGGLIGGAIELFQVGFKVLANTWSYWWVAKRSIIALGAGFSATMIGAGFLVGQDMAISIFLGAIISWLIAFPIASYFFPQFLENHSTEQAAQLLWNSELRYLGIGAMLFAGIWTFIKLIRPLRQSMKNSLYLFVSKKNRTVILPRTDRDIPTPYILFGIMIAAMSLFVFFKYIFPLEQLGLEGNTSPALTIILVLYVLGIGFLFSVITAYFSGMVGVTASPGSSIVIAGILFAAWLLLVFLGSVLPLPLTEDQLIAAEAITIIIGSVVTGVAAIANDNTQDLKVGQLVGATPWKQQLMLLLGVLVSALVIPPVMQLLFNVYGIAGVVPREGMDVGQTLPAPVAALLSAVTDAVFRNALPWGMMLLGSGVIMLIIFLNRLLKLSRWIQLSILGVAIGLYLPISSTFPLFVGGMIAMVVHQRIRVLNLAPETQRRCQQVGTLIACGLVAGSALMDVFLAIPFSLMHSPDALRLVGPGWDSYGVGLSIVVTVFLAVWIDRRVRRAV